jgi:hypothetical protein
MRFLARMFASASLFVALIAQAQTTSLTPLQKRFFSCLLNSIGGIGRPAAMAQAAEDAISTRAALTSAQAAALHSIAAEFNRNLTAIDASKRSYMSTGALTGGMVADLVSSETS